MLYILPALVLTACERVTAPKALEIADKLEDKLWREWAPSSIMSATGDMNALNLWMTSKDRSTISVARDGPMDQIGAVVVERVFIAPGGYGAPLSQRSLIAFPDNAAYGVLAFTETNADDHRGLNGFDKPAYNDLNPQPRLAVPSPREQDWWTPLSGRVVIEPFETGASCPLALDGGGMGTDSLGGSVTCNLASYDVQLQGDFVRRADAMNTLLPESMKPRHHLSVPPQHVTGIRFTVRCPSKNLLSVTRSWYGLQCLDGLAFWRSNDLFAKALKVDVREMENAYADPRMASKSYIRTLRPGVENAAPGSATVARFTLSYPDGSVVARDTATIYSANMPAAYVTWLEGGCLHGLRSGEKRQCLVDMGFYPKGPGRLLVGVVDVEGIGR